MIGAEALPLKELRNDVLLAVFIGLVQLIWIGSDQNNRTYLIRTIIHFIILITGCTLLMVWFGWLPPSQWLAIYYAGFIAAYIAVSYTHLTRIFDGREERSDPANRGGD